jgi:peptidoglycan/xylan/chitin deacetylase (PgdA/CDA1 family)
VRAVKPRRVSLNLLNAAQRVVAHSADVLAIIAFAVATASLPAICAAGQIVQGARVSTAGRERYSVSAERFDRDFGFASYAPAVRQSGMRLISSRRSMAPRPHREVAVTFDDLPAPSDSVVSYDPAALQAMTARLLAELKHYHVPAIGFVNEEKLDRGDFKQRVDLLRMWVNAGYDLGNHTYSHLDIDTTPLAAYELDFLRGEIVTSQLLRDKGMRERYFRYPFLNVGKTPEIAQAFRQFLARHGYQVAPVTINNQEYMFAAVYAHALAKGDTESADHIVAAFLSYMNQAFAYFEKFSVDTLGYEPRQVLLLHADELDTDEMGDLVKMMRARGYKFISLSHALRDPAYRLPDRYDDQMGGGVSWIEHWARTMRKNVPDGPDVPQFVQGAYQKLQ